MGCKGVGAHQISSGKYAGDDLVGVKIAHAKVVGQWVNLYIDAKDEKQRAAAEKFGRAAFAAFGPIKEVKAAKIEVSGADGKYTVTVDGGKIMKFETEPMLGGDGKTPIGYTNIKNAVGGLGPAIALCGIAPLIAAILIVPRLPETVDRDLDDISPTENTPPEPLGGSA